jgi:hypothetical protein
VFSGYVANILSIVTTASVVLLDDSGTSTNVSIMKLTPTRVYDYSGREVIRVNMTVKQVD